MRLLHTSDWHLGHSLHGFDRHAEHARFIEWLLRALGEHEVDALIIAGDIFDTANPSAEAQKLWYHFLVDARHRYPDLSIVAIGGNHDSAARLDAPDPILRALDVHVVGGLRRKADGSIDADHHVISLRKNGAILAQVIAVPFLRPSDLPRVDSTDDAHNTAIAQVYDELLESARARRTASEALIATGHLHTRHGARSEWSERQLMTGGLDGVPAEIFSSELSYVALGHLHLAQAVRGATTIRYSGSPLPLSIDEANYTHAVAVIDFDGAAVTRTKILPIPRAVDIVRIPPKTGAIEIEALKEAAATLPDVGSLAEELAPYVAIHISQLRGDPALEARVGEALLGKAARVLRVVRETKGAGDALFESRPARSLATLSPIDVLHDLHQSRFGTEPSAEMLAAFAQLLANAVAEEP